MSHTLKKLEKSQVEFTITVSPADYQKDMETAATRLSSRVAVKGFRKGHIPYDTMKKEVGEMAILQEALESIVQRTFVEALQEEKLDTVGMPKISVEKVAPDNDLEYKAVVALLPVVKLVETKKVKVKKEEPTVDDKKMTETMNALRGMHAKEVIKEGKAEGTDKLVIDMDMTLDNVPVEGGQAKNHQVYLSEDHYIPGFNKQVEGLKKGDEKEFTLDFPKTHYQKMLAGKNVDFKVKVNDVYTRELPNVDEEFAKTLGQKSVEELTALVQKNLMAEATQKANQKAEIDLLDAMIEKSKFEDIPDVLMLAEKEKMFHELSRDLEKNGIAIDQYLRDIKKTEAELTEQFTDQAIKRAKASLVSRQVAKDQGIEVSKEDLDAEVELIKQAYPNNKEAEDNLKRPEVRDSIATMVQNRKVMDYLKKEVFGEEKKA